jgi:hypothetical protein
VGRQGECARSASAINVNRYEGDINFEMTGVAHPPPQAEWTLDLQMRLISEVTPEALREARARYTTAIARHLYS